MKRSYNKLKVYVYIYMAAVINNLSANEYNTCLSLTIIVSNLFTSC